MQEVYADGKLSETTLSCSDVVLGGTILKLAGRDPPSTRKREIYQPRTTILQWNESKLTRQKKWILWQLVAIFIRSKWVSSYFSPDWLIGKRWRVGCSWHWNSHKIQRVVRFSICLPIECDKPMCSAMLATKMLIEFIQH